MLVGAAIVPTTAPVSNKSVLVGLTEGNNGMERHRPVPKSRSIPAPSIGTDWCPFISSWQTSLVTNSASRGKGLERYSSGKRTAASPRKLSVEPLTGSIGSARGRNTDDGSTHPMRENLLWYTRLTFDQTIEGEKPSPQKARYSTCQLVHARQHACLAQGPAAKAPPLERVW